MMMREWLNRASTWRWRWFPPVVWRRKWIRYPMLIMILLLLSLWLSHRWISWQTQARLYNDVNAIPTKSVALVLGTTKTLTHNRINLYFKYRINAAVALYKAGKVQHFVLSGANPTKYYNEPKDMQEALIAAGVPSGRITLDYAGFRTLDSIVRAQHIFSLNDFIIVSQAFHNQRALFIADFYGIKAIGFNAQDVPLRYGLKVQVREVLARLRAILDLYIFRTQPKFLGEKITITPQPVEKP